MNLIYGYNIYVYDRLTIQKNLEMMRPYLRVIQTVGQEIVVTS